MSKKYKKINLYYDKQRFSSILKKRAFTFSLLFILIWNFIILIIGNVYISFSVGNRTYFSLFFISFILSNAWILTKLSLYLFQKNGLDWKNLSIKSISRCNLFSDILSIFLIVSWLLFLGSWFYNLSYSISIYNTKNAISLFISQFKFINKYTTILYYFIYAFSLFINFIVFPLLVFFYWRKKKKLNNTIILDSSSLTYSFVFYRIYQHVLSSKHNKNLSKIIRTKNIKFNDIRSKKEDKITLFLKSKNPYDYFQKKYLSYENYIKKSQPFTKEWIKFYSLLIITSLWAFFITILVLIIVLFILQKNLSFDKNLFYNSLSNFNEFKLDSKVFLVMNLLVTFGTFFINTFFIHFINNNYRFFKADNENVIYKGFDEIIISMSKKDKFINSISVFPFLVLMREILLMINFSRIDQKKDYIFCIIDNEKYKSHKSNIFTHNEKNHDNCKVELYSFLFIIKFDKNKIKIEIKRNELNDQTNSLH